MAFLPVPSVEVAPLQGVAQRRRARPAGLMVLDTSALLAVLFDEPEREDVVGRIAAAPRRLVSAGSLLETSILVEARRGESAGRELDLLLHRVAARVMAAGLTEPPATRSCTAGNGGLVTHVKMRA